MNFKVKNRFQAFAVHLVISISIFLAFLLVMFIWWYPAPYFEAEGGWDVLTILIVVDVVLGPSLTLIVFKLGKPSLKFDLSVIAFVQLAALFYGAQIIYEQRPIFLVFAEGRSYLASKNDVDMTLVDESILKQLGGRGPYPVYAKMPDAAEERQKLLAEILFEDKPDVEFRTEYFEPMSSNLVAIMSTDKGIEAYFEKGKNKQVLELFMSEHADRLSDYAYFPMVGRNKKDMLLVVNKFDGSVVDALDINPWVKHE